MEGDQIITITNPLDGWAPNSGGGSGYTVEVDPKKGQYAQSVGISLFRQGKLGHIAPGETFTQLADASTRVNAMPLNGVVASNGEAYSVLQNARIVRFGVGDDTIDANYSPSLSGTHASHTAVATTNYSDIAVFKDSVGEWIVWSWEDDTDADLARIKSDGSSQDDDYFSTLTSSGVLTKGVPHVIFESPVNNYRHVTNGQYVAKFDISAGSGSTTALNLGMGYIATSGCRFGAYAAIVGYLSTSYITSVGLGQVRVWLWNGSATDPNFVFDVPDNYATNIVNDNGVLTIITTGRTATTKKWVFNGSNFQQVSEYATSIIGTPLGHGSATVFQKMLHWVPSAVSNNLAFVHAFDGPAFHQRAIATNGTVNVSALGMVKELNNNSLYVGVTQTGPTGYAIYNMNHSGYYTNATFYSGNRRLDYKMRVLWWRLVLSQFGTGASIQLSAWKNFANPSFGGAADLVNRTLTNAALGNIKEHYFRCEADDISAINVGMLFGHTQLTDTAAIVQRLEIGVRPMSGRY